MTNTAYKTRKLLSMLSCAEKENDGLMLTHNLQNMQRNGKQTGCYGHIMNMCPRNLIMGSLFRNTSLT